MPLKFRYAACDGFIAILDITIFLFPIILFYKSNPFTSFFLPSGRILPLFNWVYGYFQSVFTSAVRGVRETSVGKAESENILRWFWDVFLNYGFLKLFVEVFKWYPTPSKLLTTVLW